MFSLHCWEYVISNQSSNCNGIRGVWFWIYCFLHVTSVGVASDANWRIAITNDFDTLLSLISSVDLFSIQLLAHSVHADHVNQLKWQIKKKNCSVRHSHDKPHISKRNKWKPSHESKKYADKFVYRMRRLYLYIMIFAVRFQCQHPFVYSMFIWRCEYIRANHRKIKQKPISTAVAQWSRVSTCSLPNLRGESSLPCPTDEKKRNSEFPASVVGDDVAMTNWILRMHWPLTRTWDEQMKFTIMKIEKSMKWSDHFAMRIESLSPESFQCCLFHFSSSRNASNTQRAHRGK